MITHRISFLCKHLVAALASTLLTGSAALASHYDVYLLAGQSNMDGRGSANDLVGPLADYAGPQPNAEIWYSNGSLRPVEGRSNGWAPLQPGFSVPAGKPSDPAATEPAKNPGKIGLKMPYRFFGPEIGFAKAIRAAQPEASLALIKFSVSGANLKKEWNPGRRKLLYDQFLDNATEALAALTARGDTYTIRALLWHQGESDATSSEALYEKLLGDLIAKVRLDFKLPDLPVVLGEPFDNGKRLIIREAQRNLSKTLLGVHCVSSVGLKTGDKETHFDAASQIEIGRRFAAAVLTKADAGPVPTSKANAASTQPSIEEP